MAVDEIRVEPNADDLQFKRDVMRAISELIKMTTSLESRLDALERRVG